MTCIQNVSHSFMDPPGPKGANEEPKPHPSPAPKRSHDVPRTMTIAQQRHAGLGRPMDGLGVPRLIQYCFDRVPFRAWLPFEGFGLRRFAAAPPRACRSLAGKPFSYVFSHMCNSRIQALVTRYQMGQLVAGNAIDQPGLLSRSMNRANTIGRCRLGVVRQGGGYR